MKRNTKEIAYALAALALLSGAAGCSFSSDVAEGIGPYAELSSEGGASSEAVPSSSSEETPSSSSPASFAVAVDCGPGGTCSPASDRTVAAGEDLKVTVSAGARRFIDSVSLDGALLYASEPGDRLPSYQIALKNVGEDHAVSARFGREAVWMDCSAGGTCIPGDTTPPVGGDLALKFQADSGYKIQTVVFAGDTIFDADTTASVYGQYNFALGNYQPPRTFDFTAEFVAY